MGQNMRGFGKMIYRMGKELRSGLMDHVMRELIRKEKSMDLVKHYNQKFSNFLKGVMYGLTVRCTKANGMRTRFPGKGHTHGWMEGST